MVNNFSASISYLFSELSIAAIENNVEAFDSLIEKGCDPNYSGTTAIWDESNFTPVYLAVKHKSMGEKATRSLPLSRF